MLINWLKGIGESLILNKRDPTYPHVYYLLNSAWACQAVYIVARLDLAEKLRAGARTAQDLAEQCGVESTSLYRILRLLSAYSIFEQTSDGSFRLASAGRTLLRDHPYTVHDYAIIWGEQLLPSSTHLPEQIQGGKSGFELEFRKQAFDYYESSQHASDVFFAFMNSVTDCHLPFLVRAHKWARYTTMVDVGGGGGSFISAVLKATPTLRGCWFDRKDAEPLAEQALSRAGVSERCELVSGDFMEESLPGSADLYTVKHVLHDWDNESATKILQQIAKAMRPDSKLLIIEALVDSRNGRGGFCKLRDIEQMFWNHGRERTLAEFTEILKPAGLVVTNTTQTPIADVCLIEARFA